MIRLEELYEAYDDARRHKRRSHDSVVFAMNAEARLNRLLKEVNERTYRANSNYTFVVTRPKHREIFACEMETRILHHYLEQRLAPLIEDYLSPRTYNNRVGKGNTAAINQLIEDTYEMAEGYTRDAWYIKLDLSGCFPNIDKDIAYHKIVGFVEEYYHGHDKEDVLWLLLILLYNNPQDHCTRRSAPEMWSYIPPSKSLFGKPSNKGLAIGSLLSQTLVNLYYDDVDKWLDENDIRHIRFVDDFIITTRDKEQVLRYVVPTIRAMVEDLGGKLNERKFYCQHVSKGVEVLGSHLKMDRIYLNSKTIGNGRDAIEKLNKTRNKSPKRLRMMEIINSYSGMLKTRNGHGQLCDLLRSVDKEWWQWIEWNKDRKCCRVKDKYNHKKFLNAKYHLKWKKKKSKKSQSKTTTPKSKNSATSSCAISPKCAPPIASQSTLSSLIS